MKSYAEKYGVTLTQSMYQISPNLFLEYTPPSGAAQITAGPTTKQKFWLLTTKQQGVRGELKSQDTTVSQMNPSSLPGYLPPGDPSFSSSSAKQLARYPISVTLNMSVGQRTPQIATVNRVDGESQRESYSSGAEYYFDSGTNVELLLAQYDPKKEFTHILDLLVLLAVRISNNDKTIQLYKAKVEEVTAAVIGKMPDKIKSSTMDEFYQVLKQEKGSQPHCIARALQLLDTASIQESMPQGSTTGVCKFAVGDQAGPVNLSMYKPIKSIAQLFGKVDPVNFKGSLSILEAFVGKDTAVGPLSIGQLSEQPKEAASLKSALERLAKAFQYTQSVQSFSDIQVSRPSKCKTSEDQVVTQPLALKLQSVSQQLLAYHVNHTIEIAKFLKVIFNISQAPNGSWKVEGPKTEIMFAGFPVLDQLTDQARELLTDYYSGCETLYQKGVQSWNDEQPGKPVDPVGTGAGAPVPSAPLVPGAPGPVLPRTNSRNRPIV